MILSKIPVTLVAVFGLVASGFAADNIIYGTGVGKNPIANGTERDDHWKIVAVAGDFTIPDSQTLSYDAYVPYSVSFHFLGGNSPVWGANNGYVYNDETYYWISPNTSAAFAPFPSLWSFVAAQEFTITSAGYYTFDFWGNGDNSMAFFINGSITYTDANNPTITGGKQIGTTQGGDLSQIYHYTGTTYLTEGTHTAYAVVVDTGFDAGALITNSTFAAVPEPSTLVLGGGALLAALGIRRLGQRKLV